MAQEPPVPSAAEAEQIERLTAIPDLDLKQGLAAVRGRVAVYARLLRKYAEGYRDGLATFDARVAAGDMQEAQRLAHSLKGASGTLGAGGVHRRAMVLEQAVRDDRGPAEITGLAGDLELALATLVQAILDAVPAESVAASPAVADSAAVVAALRELEALLAEGDTQAGHRIEQLASQLRAGLGDVAREIERLIGEFDYPQALEKVRTALAKQTTRC